MDELRKRPVRFRAVSLDAAVMRAQQTQHPPVLFSDLDKRIRAEQNLHSLVAAFTIPSTMTALIFAIDTS